MRVLKITSPMGLHWLVTESEDGTLKCCRPGYAVKERMREVSPALAEVLTGLRMPAAMDRLRELVHESS